MKILHLADLHLGKILQEQSFLEDQKYMLNKIIEKINRYIKKKQMKQSQNIMLHL